MKPVNEIKDEIQKQAHAIWLGSGAQGTVVAGTGFGKSRIAVMEVARLDSLGLLTDPDDVLIVTPTEKLRDEGWPNEFKAWGQEHLLEKYVKPLCFASLKKEGHKRYKLVILDEIHRLTDLSATAFKETIDESLVQFVTENLTDSILGLTATIPDKDRDPEKSLIISKVAPVVFTYSLDQGVADGMIRDYSIRVILCPMDDEKKTIKAGSKTKPFMTTEAKQYEYMEKQIKKYHMLANNPNTKNRAGMEKMAMIATMARNRFIGNMPTKTAVAKKCLELIEAERRLLVFCADIAQCEELMAPNTYHSKRDSEAYDAFCKMEINRLGVVDAANEGINFPELDWTLITKINSNSRVLVQRIGRNLRLGMDGNAIIWILIAQGTADEKWLADCLQEFDKSKVQYFTSKSFM